jgi:hypothetical protein
MKKRQRRSQAYFVKRSRDESGVALMIVMGIILMLSLGTAVMAQNVIAHVPIVQQDLVQHEAYRAMQSGIDEYLYEANANPNYVMCNDADVYTGYPGNWTNTGFATLSSGLCSGLVLTQWTQVADLSSTSDVASWFTYGTPAIYQCNNSSNCTSGDTWEQVQVVGFATSEGQKAFQQATIVIQPSNDFLLKLWWLNYDQSDPSTLAGDPACTYYHPSNSLVSGCQAISLVTGETISGNMWVNDSVFICGTPTINGTIYTAGTLVATPGGGCTQGVPAANYVDEPQTETAPTDDAVLGSVAQQGGCLYEGPTEFDLLSTGGYDVYSPDTPISGTTDSLNATSGNTSGCVPANGWGTGSAAVTGPTNGVAFVQGCSPACNVTGYAPLGTSLANSVYEPDTAGESVGTQEGDAIVEGVDKGPLTIGAADNVVIDGDICYQSWTSCTTPPASPGTADVLALVAYNFVEVNHPMTSNFGNWVNDSLCSGTSPSQYAPFGVVAGVATAPTCDLQNPIIDAAMLALNHQFDAHNFDQGNALGNISINGAISEDWRGPVGTFGGGNTGYVKQYTYDSRLTYLSPPAYLNPGTSSWQLGAVAATTGGCPATAPACLGTLP